MSEAPIRINVQPLPSEVTQARARHEAAEQHNARALDPRIALHLQVHEKLMDRMAHHHALLVEQTDLDPAADNRAAAAWLLCGRCLALSRALIALLAAGFATEAEPTARALHEVCRVLTLILDPEEERIWRSWRRGGGWSNPKDLLRAEREHEARQAARILRLGYRPPERTDEDTAQIYRELSTHAHPKRRSILQSWEPSLRRFQAGQDRPVLVRAIWVGFGDEWIRDAYLTVGTALTQLLPAVERPDPARRVAQCEIRRDHGPDRP